jgi:hypothetical protein
MRARRNACAASRRQRPASPIVTENVTKYLRATAEKNFSLVGPRKRRFWRRRRFTRDDSQDFHHYERKRSNPEHKFFARLDCFVALWAPRNDDSMII